MCHIAKLSIKLYLFKLLKYLCRANSTANKSTILLALRVLDLCFLAKLVTSKRLICPWWKWKSTCREWYHGVQCCVLHEHIWLQWAWYDSLEQSFRTQYVQIIPFHWSYHRERLAFAARKGLSFSQFAARSWGWTWFDLSSIGFWGKILNICFK